VQSFSSRKLSRSRAPERTARAIDTKARLWTIECSTEGHLEEPRDPVSLESLVACDRIDAIIDALISASAEQDIAETRIW
jgi:hypothetical protein